jgi:hypothetical protein
MADSLILTTVSGISAGDSQNTITARPSTT